MKTGEKTKDPAPFSEEYLTTTKKKRKTYILFAVSEMFDKDTYMDAEAFIKNKYKGLTFQRVKTESEFYRFGMRQVQAVFMDDNFLGSLEINMKAILNLKLKKLDAPLPVIFLTLDSTLLMEAYQKHLITYQETDQYIEHKLLEHHVLLSKIQECVEGKKKKRRSHRFNFLLEVKYSYLNFSETQIGIVQELSIHGGLLQSNTDQIYKKHEQFKIHLPITSHLPIECGEFLKLSAKICSVMLGGKQAAFSWEHISEKHLILLTRLIISMVEIQMRHVKERQRL
jgi:hypothetical protein